MSGEDEFLGRWSRRKLQGPELQPNPETAVPVEAAPELPDERTDEEILAEFGLKHPEELQPGDDIKGFMQAAVPDRLRRVALRQLWRSNPVLANLDGLVEYGEDYTDAATVIENMQTAYQVGKGMLRDLVEEEEEPASADDEADTEVHVDPNPIETEAAADTPAEPDDVVEIADTELADEDGTTFGRANRRMAFRFD